MTGNSLDQMMRQDMRRLRAKGLAYRIADLAAKRAPRDIHCELERIVRQAAYEGACDALMEVDAELVTDHDRQEAGLPARGPDGWTVEELHALERRGIMAQTPLEVRNDL